METLFNVVNAGWPYAGPMFVCALLVLLVNVIKDIFTTE